MKSGEQQSTKARQRKRNSSPGAVMVEYAFLLLAFGVPVMAGTALAGISLISDYGNVRNSLLHKYP